MAIILPDFDRYTPDEVIKSEAGTDVSIFKGRGMHRGSSDRLVGLMHGLLGQGTSRYIAGHLRQKGIDVFTYDEDEWHPDARAYKAHKATKAAVEHTGLRRVHYVCHSDAVQAIVRSVLHQQMQDPEGLNYEIVKLTTEDGNGTNDERINLLKLAGEAKGIINLSRSSPYTSVRVYGQSVLNCITSPVTSTLQGIRAFRYDGRADIALIESANVTVDRLFHDEDYVIRPPRGVEALPGSHMTATIIPDTAIQATAA